MFLGLGSIDQPGIAMPSTVIASMRYDAASRALRIVYVSGNVYDYKDVAPEVFEKMKAARSKGSFLNRYIKGKYAFEKIETEDD